MNNGRAASELPLVRLDVAEARGAREAGDHAADAAAGAARSRGHFLKGWPAVVRFGFVSQYFNVTFSSIMLGGLFDIYLKILKGTNTFVGEVESARGLAALVAAMPLGWLGDRDQGKAKIKVLCYNLVLGIISVALLTMGIPQDSMPLVFAGVVAYAVHNQCLFGLWPALVADFTEAGDERARAMSNWQSASSLGNASGPAVQVVLLWIFGDAWSTSELHGVLCLGSVFFALYVPFQFRALQSAAATRPEAAAAEGTTTANPTSSGEASVQPAWQWLVAALLETSALLTAIGSGMTFKYWPLFFKQDFHFSPSGVCMMQLSIWLIIACTAQMAPAIARRVGRMSTVLSLHALGTGLLFMISLRQWGVALEVALVLIRNGVMNAYGPLVQALILDLVPRQHRGKWGSLASLRRVTWSGSAFVGGALSDSYDYRYAFFITACMHTLAWVVYVLVAAVQRHQSRPSSLSLAQPLS